MNTIFSFSRITQNISQCLLIIQIEIILKRNDTYTIYLAMKITKSLDSLTHLDHFSRKREKRKNGNFFQNNSFSNLERFHCTN